MKILLTDIETAPNNADVFDLWNQNISLAQLRASSYTLCWAAKWAGSKNKMMFGANWTDPDDFIVFIHHLLDEADAVVTYNGDRFDLPTLRKEFLLRDLGPTSPFQSIDIYKTVKKQFKFPSYKLDYVGQTLGVGSKLKHPGMSLWTDVVRGDEKAQRLMTRYCKQDVTLLESVHDILVPWIPNYPNRDLYKDELLDELACKRCENGQLRKRGFSYTATGRFQSFRCDNCGGYAKSTRREGGSGVRSV